MSILTANLKHFYQNRFLWIVYLWLVLLSLHYIAGIIFNFQNYEYICALYPLMIAFFIGNFIVSMQTGILSKPFTYCLPGHRKNIRFVLLIAGAIISLLYSLPFLWRLDVGLLKSYGLFICVIFADLTFYWLGVIFKIFIAKESPIRFILSIIIIAILLYALYVAREFVTQYPFLLIISGILFSVLAWKLLGDEKIARRYCAKPVGNLSDIWDSTKIQRKRGTFISEKYFKEYDTTPKVEQYFLSHIHRSQTFDTARYIWGSLYERFGVYSKTIIKLIPFLIILMLFLGYSRFASCIFFIGILTFYNRIPVFSSLLVSGGRHERFLATTVIIAINMIVITIFCTIIAAFSILIKDMMPEIFLFGETFSFHEADIRLFFVPILTIPIVSMFNLVFYRKQMIIMILNMLLCYSLIFLAYEISSNQKALQRDEFEIILPNPEIIIAAIFLSWSLFLVVLKYICERKSLVK